MSKLIFFILILLFGFIPLKAKSQNCLTADMMVLIDWSGSERYNEIQLATAAYMFASELPISEYQLRIGIMAFSDCVEDVVELTGNKEKLLNGISILSLTEASGGTYINKALDYSCSELNNKRNVPKIIVIISDGEIYDMEQSLSTLQIWKTTLPLSIYAIQIGGDKAGYKNLWSFTESNDKIEFSLPNNLVEALKKLNFCN